MRGLWPGSILLLSMCCGGRGAGPRSWRLAVPVIGPGPDSKLPYIPCCQNQTQPSCKRNGSYFRVRKASVCLCRIGCVEDEGAAPQRVSLERLETWRRHAAGVSFLAAVLISAVRLREGAPPPVQGTGEAAGGAAGGGGVGGGALPAANLSSVPGRRYRCGCKIAAVAEVDTIWESKTAQVFLPEARF